MGKEKGWREGDIVRFYLQRAGCSPNHFNEHISHLSENFDVHLVFFLSALQAHMDVNNLRNRESAAANFLRNLYFVVGGARA